MKQRQFFGVLTVGMGLIVAQQVYAGEDSNPQSDTSQPISHSAATYQLHVAGDFVDGMDPKTKGDIVCRGQHLLGGLVQVRGEGDNYLTCSAINLN